MKGHIFYEIIDPLTNNWINYLFIPDKEVVINLGPKLGDVVFKNRLDSYFNLNLERIKEVEENIRLYKTGKNPEYFKYVGETDNIPKKSLKKLDNLIESKKNVIRISFLLRAQEEIESKKLEELVKGKFDLT